MAAISASKCHRKLLYPAVSGFNLHISPVCKPVPGRKTTATKPPMYCDTEGFGSFSAWKRET